MNRIDLQCLTRPMPLFCLPSIALEREMRDGHSFTTVYFIAGRRAWGLRCYWRSAAALP